MDGRELERLNRRLLLPSMPGYEAKGPLVFASPVGDILRGLYFEPSGFRRDTRRIDYFVMPLYEPWSGEINFSFAVTLSERRRHDRWWDFPSEDRTRPFDSIRSLVLKDALPWLERFGSANGLARSMSKLRRDESDPYVAAATGLSRIVIGDPRKGAGDLRRIRKRWGSDPDLGDWLPKVMDEMDATAELAESSPADALARLRDWRLAALASLGLARWADTTRSDQCLLAEAPRAL